MISRYSSPIDAIQDSIDRNKEIFRVRENNRKVRSVEFNHFKNVVLSRLGNDPAVLRVVNSWPNDKEPAYCEIQLLGAKEWTKQEETDIEGLYKSFKTLNASLWEAERKYQDNPDVLALVNEIRHSSDVRVIAFQLRLASILKKAGGTK